MPVFSFSFLSPAPVNVNASAPADHQLKVTWDKPNELYPYMNITQNSTVINTWISTKVLNITYTVTCNSNDAPTLQRTTKEKFVVFSKVHGVRAGTDYTCHVTMTVRAHNGSSLGGGALGVITTKTTPKSEEVTVTTIEGKGLASPLTP